MRVAASHLQILAAAGVALVLQTAAAQPQTGTLSPIVDARIGAEDTPLCIAAGVVSASSVERTVRCAAGAANRLRPDAIIEIGSISKAFLGVLLADASLRGEVKLDDPLAKHLPAGAKVPSFGGGTITLLDLASQSSGLPRLPMGFVPLNPTDPYAHLTEASLLSALEAAKPERAPGVRYEYSNFGALLLSLALSRATGKPFDVLVAERIAAPLGMTTTFVTVPPSLRAREAQGHAADGTPVPAWTIDPKLAGVGMIRSTLDDMMKFAAANLTPPDNVLGRAIALSHRMQRAAAGGEIGLFWHRRASGTGSTIVWHNGGTGGFRTMLAIDATRGVAAFAAADTAVSVDDLPIHLVDSSFPLKIAFEPAWLDDYVGRYQLAPNFVLTFTRKGRRLFAQASQQSELEVLAQARDRIVWQAVPAQATFVRDEAGRVTGLDFTQAGRTTRAQRLP